MFHPLYKIKSRHPRELEVSGLIAYIIAEIKAIMYFAKFLNAFVKPRNLNFSRNKIYIWNLQITKFPFRRYIICWGNVSLSKIIGGGGGGGGGHPAPPHPFILQNCVL